MSKEPSKRQRYENEAAHFAHHVQMNLVNMKRIPTKGERIHEVNKAFTMLHSAIDSGHAGDLYAAAVHLAAAAGKLAMRDGNREHAVQKALRNADKAQQGSEVNS